MNAVRAVGGCFGFVNACNRYEFSVTVGYALPFGKCGEADRCPTNAVRTVGGFVRVVSNRHKLPVTVSNGPTYGRRKRCRCPTNAVRAVSGFAGAACNCNKLSVSKGYGCPVCRRRKGSFRPIDAICAVGGFAHIACNCHKFPITVNYRLPAFCIIGRHGMQVRKQGILPVRRSPPNGSRAQGGRAGQNRRGCSCPG